MLSLFGGSSGTRLPPTDSATGIKRKRDSIRPENELEIEEVRECMPREHDSTGVPRSSRMVFNSSKQLPSRSAEHNYDMTSISPGQHLLRLPATIRNRILQDVLVTQEAYVVQADGRIEPKTTARYLEEADNRWILHSYVTRKPGVFETCKVIREEARRKFCSGNNFEIQISAFNANAIVPWWKRRVTFLNATQEEPIEVAIASDTNGLYEDVSGRAAHSVRPKLDSSETSLPYKSKALLYQKKRQAPTALLAEGDSIVHAQYEPHWGNLKEWLQLFHAGAFTALPGTTADIFDEKLNRVSAMFDSVAAYKDGDTWETAEKGLEGHRKILIADDRTWALPAGEVQGHVEGKVERLRSSFASTTTATIRHQCLDGSQTLREESPACEHRLTPFTDDSFPDADDVGLEEEYHQLTPRPETFKKAIFSATKKAETGGRNHPLFGPAYASHFAERNTQVSKTLVGDETPSDGLLLPTSRSSRRKTTPVGHFEGMDAVPSPKERDAQKSKKRKTEHDRRVRQGSEEL